MKAYAAWPWGKIFLVGYLFRLPFRVTARAAMTDPYAAFIVLLGADILFIALAGLFIAALIIRWRLRKADQTFGTE